MTGSFYQNQRERVGQFPQKKGDVKRRRPESFLNQSTGSNGVMAAKPSFKAQVRGGGGG